LENSLSISSFTLPFFDDDDAGKPMTNITFTLDENRVLFAHVARISCRL